MKTILFLIMAMLATFANAGGDPNEVTNYGGSNDSASALEYPSCYDHQKYPDTDYYAAVSTKYNGNLCFTNAIAMGVDRDRIDSEYVGKMVRVTIVDSCSECEKSHLDISPKAFGIVCEKGKGRFKSIWLASTKEGAIKRTLVYDEYETKKFASEKYGLGLTDFLDKYEAQAVYMVKNGIRSARFDKNGISSKPKTTTRKSTIVQTATISTGSQTTITSGTNWVNNVTVPLNTEIQGLGNVTVSTNTTVIEVKPVEMGDRSRDNENLEEEKDSDSFASTSVIAFAGAITGAAGIGLLYLKRKSPAKYEDLKSKFPEAFANVKRSVSRSATSIKRGFTRSIRKTGSGRIVKNSSAAAAAAVAAESKSLNRHGNHDNENERYNREMPDYMFGSDNLPRISLYDVPISSFPDNKDKKEEIFDFDIKF